MARHCIPLQAPGDGYPDKVCTDSEGDDNDSEEAVIDFAGEGSDSVEAEVWG